MADLKNVDLRDFDDDDFSTIVAKDMTLRGVLRFKAAAAIRGCVKGAIDATGDVVIDGGATVEGNVAADRVLVCGKIVGNISAATMAFLSENSSVEGDIEAKDVVIERGATFNGTCKMPAKG